MHHDNGVRVCAVVLLLASVSAAPAFAQEPSGAPQPGVVSPEKRQAALDRPLNLLAAQISELTSWRKTAVLKAGAKPMPGCEPGASTDSALKALLTPQFLGAGMDAQGSALESVGGEVLEYYLCSAIVSKDVQKCDGMAAVGSGIGESSDDCRRLYDVTAFSRALLRGGQSTQAVCKDGAIHGLLSKDACMALGRGVSAGQSADAICAQLTRSQKREAGMSDNCPYQVSLLLGRGSSADCRHAANPIDKRLCRYTIALREAALDSNYKTCDESGICGALMARPNACAPSAARLRRELCQTLQDRYFLSGIEKRIGEINSILSSASGGPRRFTSERQRFKSLTGQYGLLRKSIRSDLSAAP